MGGGGTIKSADYWRSRFSILEETAHLEADRMIQNLEEIYLDAQHSVQKEIESWYGRFAKNNQLSLTDAKKMLSSRQLEEFKWSVEKYIKVGKKMSLDPVWMKKLENASARFHVSRLEAIQTEIQQQIEFLFGNQVDGLDQLLKKVVGNGYTQTAYEIQKGIGLGWDITALDQRKLETLLSKPWTTDGKTFRDRCWVNKAELVERVHKHLIQGMLRGDSPEKSIAAIQKEFAVSRYKARRLVHTETSYFNACSNRESYRDLGIERDEVLETLDARTCEVCQPMDGKVILLSQYEPGVTVPPYHPNCRGTTCPYYDDMDGERAARDADGKVYYVPANMSYEQWKKAFVNSGSKKELTLFAASDIIKARTKKNGGSDVQTVGRIHLETYRCITDDISTDEVIITSERIEHIKERHPGAFEKVKPFLEAALKTPDYILADDKNPNTGLILKLIEKDGLRIQMVIRVHTSTDAPEFKNSIISAWEISESRWNNYVNNKKVLYKRE